jgi:hypothetical protein
MTDQIKDQIIYNEEILGIADVEGKGLFTAMDFELDCKSAASACWRGYLMQYSLEEDQLILNNIWFKPKISDVKDLPKIQEKNPILITRENELAMGFFFTHAYKDLNLNCSFNGDFSTFKETNTELFHLKFNFEDGLLIDIESISLGAPEPNATFESVEKEMLEEFERLKKLQKGEE